MGISLLTYSLKGPTFYSGFACVAIAYCAHCCRGIALRLSEIICQWSSVGSTVKSLSLLIVCRWSAHPSIFIPNKPLLLLPEMEKPSLPVHQTNPVRTYQTQIVYNKQFSKLRTANCGCRTYYY